MAKIYVGCSLTGAPQKFLDEVERLKVLLREDGHQVADFVGTVNGTPADVYETDIHQCVAGCELFVAVCDLPSTGLGWELGVAVEKHRKPTLALAHRDTKITRLVLGAEGEKNPLFRFRRYSSLEDVPLMVEQFLSETPTRAA